MDPWELICALTKLVVETKEVYLDIYVTQNQIEIQLLPWGDSPGDFGDLFDDLFNEDE